jgi:Protein tyrosine and serine/threonine kinase
MNGPQVFTGAIPFSHIKSDASVIMFILSGGRPKQERCPQINDEIWEMLEKCWDVVPKRRPSMATLSRFFSLQTTSITAERARL